MKSNYSLTGWSDQKQALFWCGVSFLFILLYVFGGCWGSTEVSFMAALIEALRDDEITIIPCVLKNRTRVLQKARSSCSRVYYSFSVSRIRLVGVDWSRFQQRRMPYVTDVIGWSKPSLWKKKKNLLCAATNSTSGWICFLQERVTKH